MCFCSQLLISAAFFCLSFAEYSNQNAFSQFSPESQQKEISQTVKKGDTFKLACGIEENEQLGVMWKKDGQFITGSTTIMYKPLEERLKIHKSGYELEFMDAQTTDAGEYVCLLSESQTYTQRINIIYLENITLIPNGTLDLKSGSRLNLICLANGYPKAIPQWTFEDQPLNKGEKRNATGELIIDDVSPADAGTYRCILNNGIERKASVMVNVIASSNVMKKPKEGKLEVHTGDEIKLNCHIDGKAQLKILWFFKDKQMVGTGEELVVPNVQQDNAGPYQCRVMTDLYENMNASFYVKVLPPSSSSSLGSEAAAVESVPTDTPSGATKRTAQLVSILAAVILTIFFW